MSKMNKKTPKKASKKISNHKLTSMVKTDDSLHLLESKNRELSSIIDAISKSQAMIEFNLDGTIITANDNFLNAIGYSLNEIKGQHHRIFCEPKYAQSPAYQQFWQKLNRGEFDHGEYKRLGKGGKEIWINASYNPILDAEGKPFKIVKFATDITQQKIESAENKGKIEAIDKSQAVIEFNLDGTIITANDNFLGAMGYSLNEIKGQHHRIFCEPKYTQTADYKQFWEKLNRGEYDHGEYKRLGKGGKEIWINASYNPILDAEGKPFKVVKFATDITQQKLDAAENAGKMEAIDKAQAVIEFNLDGTIIKANDNFLNTVGYSLDEIKGKHHRMFCEPEYTKTQSYREFWEKLNRGEFDAGEYKRLGKGGKEIWINASYNPIFNADGKAVKVVKYATDVTQIKNVIQNVVNTANEFLDGAQVIAEKSSSLSQSAQDTSATVEEMSASVEELTASIDSIAKNAQDADSIATNTVNEAQQGEGAVQKSIEAMELISKSSEQISEIIKVISEIASQTNLLALNAAIEAARAGEHGLGFAVVADEVRKLAERSSEAAKEITSLIHESEQRVSQGSDLSEQMGEALKKIMSGVEKTSAAIAQIASAAEEQASTASEVNKGVQNVATVSEQNSATSEELNSSSQELTNQAQGLKELMNQL